VGEIRPSGRSTVIDDSGRSKRLESATLQLETHWLARCTKPVDLVASVNVVSGKGLECIADDASYKS
jgi:hypothetical protein